MPLSLLNIFDYTTLNKILIYPFQLLNVFEIIYWIALAYGISKLINNNFDKAFKIVLSSYIPALIVWVVFVMFLTITLNPA
jgi:ABC-type transport system involved in cytochrome bd biosynthesis fused ATPase/permease subunit